jgi:hypothetical protein
VTSCVRLRPVRGHPATRGFAAIGSPEPSSPAALGYEIAGGTLKKVGQCLTWTLGLQDIDEHNLKALRRLGKRILGQTTVIWSYRDRA